MKEESEISDGSSTKKFENILIAIKPFGKWQLSIVLSLTLLMSIKGLAGGIFVFQFLTPHHVCKEAEENVTSQDQCFLTNNSLDLLSNSSLEKCQEWEFDRKVMENTAIVQWNLVCDNKLYAAHGITIYFLGYLFGASIGGYLSDKFGRKITLVTSTFLCGLFGVLQALTPLFWGFLLFRFLTGLTYMAATMASHVLLNEVVISKHRALVIGIEGTYSLGLALSSAAAYFLRDWRHLLTLGRLPFIPLAFFLWIVLPESPRWLLSVGQVRKSQQIIEKAAKCNGVSPPAALELEAIAADTAQEDNHTKRNIGFLQVFKYPALILRTLNLILCWSVIAMVYYGLMLNIVNFSGNLFLNNAINGLVGIPNVFLLMAVTRWSRKKPLVFFLLFVGLCLFIIPWIPNETIKLILALAGKFGITLTFNLIYLYTVELYPTTIRSSALGACSTSARIGSLLSPYIALISVWNPALKWVPMSIYGLAAIVSGLLVCLGPETAGKRLPETFHDAIKL